MLKESNQTLSPKCVKFKTGCAFKNNKLYIFNAKRNQMIVVSAWPNLKAWILERPHTHWKPLFPEIFIADRQVQKPERLKPKSFLDAEYHRNHLSDAEGSHVAHYKYLLENKEYSDSFKERLKTQRDCLETFFNLIPERIRKAVAPLPFGQWNALRLCSLEPRAVELFETNPALGVMLANNNYFRTTKLHRPMRSARSLLGKPRRKITGWLGFPESESTVKVLGKIDPAACHPPALRTVRSLLKKESPTPLLREVPKLNGLCLHFLSLKPLQGKVTFRFLDELCFHQQDSIRQDRIITNLNSPLDTLIDTFSLMKTLNIEHPFPVLHSLRHLTRFHDHCVELLNEKGWSEQEDSIFPEPPFAGNDDILPITTAKALYFEGQKMKHCVYTRREQIETGHAYIYHFEGEEPLTFEIVQIADDWKLIEVQGKHNSNPSPQSLKKIETWLWNARQPF